jgi:myo-inositol-1(or 4)-monophosphatase
MNDYLDFSIEFARKAGEIIRANFTLGMTKEWKQDNTPITVTDTEINALLIKEVQSRYPGHAVLGEEESHEQEADYVWVCDPVDGTFPFSHGLPVSTFSLALTHNGESIVGVAYDPYMDRLFSAEKGRGAFLNGQPIHVSDANSLHNLVMDIEWWYTSPFNLEGLTVALMKEGVRPFGLISAVYPSLLTASGDFGGVIFSGNTPWDAAAVKVIVEEAGGKVTDIFGNEQRYDQPIKGSIATNGLVHDQLVKIIGSILEKNTK